MTGNEHKGAELIECGPDLKLNAAWIASLSWDRRHYFNGPGDCTLVVTMHDGMQHRIRHAGTVGWGGVDAYDVERRICAALPGRKFCRLHGQVHAQPLAQGERLDGHR